MEDGWPHSQLFAAFAIFLAAARTERCPGPRVLVVAAHCAVSALAQPSLLLEDTVGLMVCSRTWYPCHILQTDFVNCYYHLLYNPNLPVHTQKSSYVAHVATNLQFHSDIS